MRVGWGARIHRWGQLTLTIVACLLWGDGFAALGSDWLNWFNDDFDRRIGLNGARVSGSFYAGLASVEPGEPLPYSGSMWWSWTAPADGQVRLNASVNAFMSSSFEGAECAVFVGSAVSQLTLVTNIVFPRRFGGFDDGTVWFPVQSGTVYQIAMAGGEDISGSFELVWGATPANDDFALRAQLPSGGGRYEAIVGMPAAEPFEPGASGVGSAWWSWTALTSGPVTVTVEQRRLFPLGDWTEVPGPRHLAIFAGQSLPVLRKIPSIDELWWIGPFTIQSTFEARGGETYHFQVGDFQNPTNGMVMNVGVGSRPSVFLTAPTGDAVLSGGVRLEAFASDPDGDLAHVEFFRDGGAWGPSGVALARVDSPPYALRTNLPGGIYYLRAIATDLQGAKGSSAPVLVRVRPANDDFARRTILSGAAAAVTIDDDASFASREAGEPTVSGEVPEEMGTRWYSWTAPAAGSHTFFVEGDEGGMLEVFVGTVLSELQGVGVARGNRPLTVHAAAGTVYALALLGAAPGTGWRVFPGTPPRVTLCQPADGMRLTPGEPLTLRAVVVADTAVREVRFFGLRWFDGARFDLGVTSAPPGELTTVVDRYGPQEWWAEAIDVDGRRGVSAAVRTTTSFPSLPNGDFVWRARLAGADLVATGAVHGATSEDWITGATAERSWWSWTAPSNGPWTILVTNAARHQFSVGIQTGMDEANLEDVPAESFEDWWGPSQCQKTFSAVAGTEYSFSVATEDGTTAAQIVLQPGRPPGIELTAEPAECCVAGQTLVLRADVSPGDSGGPIGRVEFYRGVEWIASRTEAPYRLEIPVEGPDIHPGFIAVAVDARGFRSASEPVYPRLQALNHTRDRAWSIMGTPVVVGKRAAGRGWWEWVAPGAGLHTVTAFDPRNGDLLLAVYGALDERALVPVVRTSGVPAQVTFSAVAGARYHFEVESAGDARLGVSSGGVPVIRLTQPLWNAEYASGMPVAVSIAGTGGGAIEAVEYFVDGWPVARAEQAPFGSMFVPVWPGWHNVTARAHGVGLWRVGTAPITIHVGLPVPANDDFARRLHLAGPAVIVTTLAAGSTLESAEPGATRTRWGQAVTGSLWWGWTAPASGPVVIRVQAGSSSEQVECFEGAEWGGLRPVPDSETNLDNVVVAQVRAGIGYSIRWSTAFPEWPNQLSISVLQDFLALDAMGRDESGRLFVRYRASLDRNWRILIGADLETWSPWRELPVVDGRLEWTDPTAVVVPRRFYRLEPWP